MAIIACFRLLGYNPPMGFSVSRRDAELLKAHVLGIRREELLLRPEYPLNAEQETAFQDALRRRSGGECVAVITGRKDFRRLSLRVTADVLVPRPDTETLVEAAVEYASGRPGPLSVLDLCTGSGAAGLALLDEIPGIFLTASDISKEALAVARQNYELLFPGAGSARFVLSDLFDALDGRFDLIVSNPPYVPSGEIAGLAPEVRREPRLALDGGPDGLGVIRPIIAGAGARLIPGGALLLEAAPPLMDGIHALLAGAGFTSICRRNDLSGSGRVICGTKKQSAERL